MKKLDKNEECVAKIISLGRKIAEYGPEMILKLQTLLMSLSHPNILKTISIPIQNEQVCVVEELFVLYFSNNICGIHVKSFLLLMSQKNK